jgi:hypothetical protein
VYVAVAGTPVTRAVDNRAQQGLGATIPAAPTELPAAQVVTSAANIPATRNDSRKTDKPTPGIARAVAIDPKTDTVVFRSLDANTGRVIDQVPAQALLRQRAYEDAQSVQALIKGKSVSTSELAVAADVDTTA